MMFILEMHCLILIQVTIHLLKSILSSTVSFKIDENDNEMFLDDDVIM